MKQTLLTRTDENVGEGIFDSIAWAFEVHLEEPDLREFHSAVLFGSEEAPEKIEFYQEPQPLVTSQIARTWCPQ